MLTIFQSILWYALLIIVAFYNNAHISIKRRRRRRRTPTKLSFLSRSGSVEKRFRSIIVESEKLKTKYDEPVIGKRAQSFPPKYTTFARINRVDVAEACQVMGHKMTWEIRSSGGGGPWPEEEAGCSGEDTIQWVHSMRTPGKTILRVWSHIIPMIEWLVWRKNNWLRNLEVGEAHGHWDRVKSALKNKDCHVPVLYGMVKDHKPRAPGAQPKMRWRIWV